ncbi:hypothetical protein CFC21_001399 [Triticum aestivum]|uniref:Uncharacterized protein n=1 Tax=Triticum aestivum TaxID=4565 RepID=A0A3B5XX35_WHEAT|nr:hypothetical protein CFC21_001399 [Triticum aestivum]
MMPCNISDPVAHGDTGAKEVWQERAKDGGVIPDSGCPTVELEGSQHRGTWHNPHSRALVIDGLEGLDKMKGYLVETTTCAGGIRLQTPTAVQKTTELLLQGGFVATTGRKGGRQLGCGCDAHLHEAGEASELSASSTLDEQEQRWLQQKLGAWPELGVGEGRRGRREARPAEARSVAEGNRNRLPEP